jgi:16S rRNA processing protein RimM
VKGWIRVHSFTEPPEGLLRFARWSLRAGRADERREYRLLEGRRQGGSLIARLETVEGRTAAQALRGASIEVLRDALPPPGERQFYRADLIGLAVRNLEGAELGKVLHFMEVPAHAVMVVRGERDHWIPATPRHLRSVDLAAGQIVVDWPALLE